VLCRIIDWTRSECDFSSVYDYQLSKVFEPFEMQVNCSTHYRQEVSSPPQQVIDLGAKEDHDSAILNYELQRYLCYSSHGRQFQRSNQIISWLEPSALRIVSVTSNHPHSSSFSWLSSSWLDLNFNQHPNLHLSRAPMMCPYCLLIH